jgi:hypothetical protein
MVYTMVYTMVLQKSVRVNEESGGFLGVPWYVYTMVYTMEYTIVYTIVSTRLN